MSTEPKKHMNPITNSAIVFANNIHNAVNVAIEAEKKAREATAAEMDAKIQDAINKAVEAKIQAALEKAEQKAQAAIAAAEKAQFALAEANKNAQAALEKATNAMRLAENFAANMAMTNNVENFDAIFTSIEGEKKAVDEVVAVQSGGARAVRSGGCGRRESVIRCGGDFNRGSVADRHTAVEVSLADLIDPSEGQRATNGGGAARRTVRGGEHVDVAGGRKRESSIGLDHGVVQDPGHRRTVDDRDRPSDVQIGRAGRGGVRKNGGGHVRRGRDGQVTATVRIGVARKARVAVDGHCGAGLGDHNGRRDFAGNLQTSYVRRCRGARRKAERATHDGGARDADCRLGFDEGIENRASGIARSRREGDVAVIGDCIKSGNGDAIDGDGFGVYRKVCTWKAQVGLHGHRVVPAESIDRERTRGDCERHALQVPGNGDVPAAARDVEIIVPRAPVDGDIGGGPGNGDRLEAGVPDRVAIEADGAGVWPGSVRSDRATRTVDDEDVESAGASVQHPAQRAAIGHDEGVPVALRTGEVLDPAEGNRPEAADLEGAGIGTVDRPGAFPRRPSQGVHAATTVDSDGGSERGLHLLEQDEVVPIPGDDHQRIVGI